MPNQLAFVTCGAVGRSFRFAPSREVVSLLWYALAVMVERHRVQIHEAIFMSNHFHLLLTDSRGVLPDFMRDLNSLLSRGLNALRRSNGSNVEKGYNIVRPTDEARVIQHAVYTLTNPCNAHLVENAHEWTSVTSLGHEYGVPVTVRRPSEGLWGSATVRTTLPATVDFVLVRPAVMPERSDAALRALIRQEVRCAAADLSVHRRTEGRSVLGMSRAEAVSYVDTPSTYRASRTSPIPQVSGESPRAIRRAIERLRAFEEAYAIARDSIAGVLREAKKFGRELAEQFANIYLPDGTFLLRRRYGALCGTVS